MEMLAYCGLNCMECGAYVATRTNDEDLRREVAVEWSGLYHADIQAKDIRCEGCTTVGGVHFRFCGECEMRRCAMERGLPTCAQCPEYPCETLSSFFSEVPEAQARLELIHASL